MLVTCNRIERPEDAHNVRTPAEYMRLLANHIARARASRPSAHIQWPTPHDGGPVTPVISQGRWLVACPCGNYPSYDPEWELAVCLDCAAVYKPKPPARWIDIEQCLMRRPLIVNRNMEAGETLAVLRRENDEHGLGEGA